MSRKVAVALLVVSLLAVAPAVALAHGGGGSSYCVNGSCYHYPGIVIEYRYDPYYHHYDMEYRYHGPLYPPPYAAPHHRRDGYWHRHTETRVYWHWHERGDRGELGAFLMGAFLGYLLGVPAH